MTCTVADLEFFPDVEDLASKPKQRPKRLRAKKRPLTVAQILAWADAHQERSGQWPTQDAGIVQDALAESWAAIDMALRSGHRELPGGSSLAKILAEYRGVKNHLDRPRLTQKQILAWADSHYRRTGHWPKKMSGPVAEDPHETWNSIHLALLRCKRGLRSRMTLAQFLKKHRKVINHLDAAPLTEQQILRWADLHYRRTGDWPHLHSGQVLDALARFGSTLTRHYMSAAEDYRLAVRLRSCYTNANETPRTFPI